MLCLRSTSLFLPFMKVLLGIKSLDYQRTCLSFWWSLLPFPSFGPWAVFSLLAETPHGTDLTRLSSTALQSCVQIHWGRSHFVFLWPTFYIRAWLFRTMTHLLGGNSFLAYGSKRHFSSCNPPTFWFRWDIWWIFFIVTSCVFLFPLH